MLITVAIPVLDGGASLGAVLDAVRDQRFDGELELVVCDSGSSDGSPSLARSRGAEVFAIEREHFGHGRTRNLLMERSQGSHVAFLTQDAVPEDDRWLSRLVAGFSLGDDVALTFGPYRPAPGASPMVARELTQWFASLSVDGEPRLERLAPDQRGAPNREFMGPRGFFTDANGCVARSAWERVRFRDVAYAEDHVLAQDMLRAGFAKAYVPDAGVIHSHDYSTLGWLRRSFDEARAVRGVYGFKAPLNPRVATLNVYGRVGADWRWARSGGLSGTDSLAVVGRSSIHHAAREVGTLLGGRSDRMPARIERRLSLERRGR